MWVCVCVFRSVVGSELVFSDQRWWLGGWVRQHWWTVGYGVVDGCCLMGLVGVGLVFFFFFFFFVGCGGSGGGGGCVCGCDGCV